MKTDVDRDLVEYHLGDWRSLLKVIIEGGYYWRWLLLKVIIIEDD